MKTLEIGDCAAILLNDLRKSGADSLDLGAVEIVFDQLIEDTKGQLIVAFEIDAGQSYADFFCKKKNIDLRECPETVSGMANELWLIVRRLYQIIRLQAHEQTLSDKIKALDKKNASAFKKLKV